MRGSHKHPRGWVDSEGERRIRRVAVKGIACAGGIQNCIAGKG